VKSHGDNFYTVYTRARAGVIYVIIGDPFAGLNTTVVVVVVAVAVVVVVVVVVARVFLPAGGFCSTR